jgi:hypothetical protein
MEIKEMFYIIAAGIMLVAIMWDSLEDRRSA